MVSYVRAGKGFAIQGKENSVTLPGTTGSLRPGPRILSQPYFRYPGLSCFHPDKPVNLTEWNDAS